MRPPHPLELVDDIVLFANGSMLTRLRDARGPDYHVLSLAVGRLASHQASRKSRRVR
ncbi:hypothetical protein CGRA01v4_08978 [Colletotrichum graminicola]|nr:hypothetical protein CGRA01v4_08978 [Colletotrichum graminicola]